MKRILTALGLIPAAVWVVLAADSRVFLAVVALAACLCYREYNAIAEGYGFGAPGMLGYCAGLLLLVWGDAPWPLFVALMLITLMTTMRDADLSHALPRAALLLLGVVYVFGCWKCAQPLREIDRHWLMYGLMLNWVGDIGAYYVGRPFGKRKLAPRVSPKKSWEGSVASVFASVLVGTLYLHFFIPSFPLVYAIGLTALANAAGQMGDLAESAMKRGANVKDSGAMLPGHGGFLDRVDSTLFALPVIYCFLAIYLRSTF
jgi:phosphatidate cytidylyltransferase